MAHRGRSSGGRELQVHQGPKLTLTKGLLEKGDISQILSYAGGQLSHDPSLTENDKVSLILTDISGSFLQAQRIAASAGEPATSTMLYQISSRAFAEAVLNAILTYRYPLTRNILKNVNILTYDQKTYTIFDNMMTEIQAAVEGEKTRDATVPMSISPGPSVDPPARTDHGSYAIPELQLAQGRKLALKKGGITQERVDVIVNAANSQLAHGGGVAGALNRASNRNLQNYSNEYIRQHGPLPVGGACATRGGGSLQCQYVVHAVGPEASPGLSDNEAARLISTATRNSLWEAEKLGAGSIALPAISCGIFGINRELSAGAILDAILHYNPPRDANILSDIRIVINDQPTYSCFVRVMTQKEAALRGITGAVGAAGSLGQGAAGSLGQGAAGSPGQGAAGSLGQGARANLDPRNVLSVTPEPTDTSSPTTSKKEFQLAQGRRLRLKKGDIAQERVDVIVNAANRQLAHGGGVAGALNRASNRNLQNYSNEYIRQHGQLPVGGACATRGGGSLQCQYVVHAVGPQASKTLADNEAARLISTAIRNSLSEAEKLGAGSIALPAISCGTFAINRELSAGAILDAILQYQPPRDANILRDIRIVINDQPTYACFVRVMNQKEAELRGRTGAVEFQLAQGRKLRLKKGDIARERVDVIVNAANCQLTHGGGVAGALNRASNGNLQNHSNQYINQYGQLPVGGACATRGGGSLQCQYVVHAVGPQASLMLPDSKAAYLISTAIRNSLWEAQKVRATSIAIPAISCGLFGINREISAGAILDAILYCNYPTEENILSDIRIVILDQPTYACFVCVMNQKWAESRGRKATGGVQQLLPHQLGSNVAATSSIPYMPLISGNFQQPLAHQLRSSVAAASSEPYVPLIAGGVQQLLPHHLGSNVAATPSEPYVPLFAGGVQRLLPHQIGLDVAATSSAPYVPLLPGSIQPLSPHQLGIGVPETSPKAYEPLIAGRTQQPIPHQPASKAAATSPKSRVPLLTDDFQQQLSRRVLSPKRADPARAGDAIAAASPTSAARVSAKPFVAPSSPIATDAKACSICSKKNPVNKVKMTCCQQILCYVCHRQAFRESPYCPVCPKVKKIIARNQPMDATMSCLVSLDSLPDHPGLGTIVITYHVPDGIQTQEHPSPGERYHGTTRTAYLPNNTEGREVLELLQRAFKARLIFTIANHHVTWNGISHKTSTSEGVFGYPDPAYFADVRKELRDKGIF